MLLEELISFFFLEKKHFFWTDMIFLILIYVGMIFLNWY